MRRAVVHALLVAIAVGGAVSSTGAAAAGGPPERVVVDGTYQRLVVEGRQGRAGLEQDVLVDGDAAHVVDLGGRPVVPGSRVQVRGRARTSSDGTVHVTADATTVLEPSPVLPRDTAPSQRLRVLVVLASWTGPDAVTPLLAETQLLHEDGAWFSEVSSGALSLTGDVTPWLAIEGPDAGRCYTNHRQTMSQAKAAAAAAGFDPSSYDRTVLYHPASSSPDCAGYTGWAYQPGTEVWLNGVLERRTTVHELGHTLGLGHAAALHCKDSSGAYVTTDETGCVRGEYGDPFDVMGGSGYSAHFSAVNKARLGWLPGRVAELAVDGRVTLAPLHLREGTVAATFQSGGRTYWLERRERGGFDAGLPLTATLGVLVRVVDAAGGAALLDLKPDGAFSDATLAFGGSWQTPEGTWLHVGQPRSGPVEVRLSMTAKLADTTPPGEVTALTAVMSKSSKSMTLTWRLPDDPDLTAVQVRTLSGAGVATGDVLYEGLGGLITIPTPKGKQAMRVILDTRDGAGNVSAGVQTLLTAKGLR